MRARSGRFEITGEVESMYARDDQGDAVSVDNLDDAEWLYLKKDKDGTVVHLLKERDEVRIAK